MRDWETKLDSEHRKWSYELDCKPTLDLLGVTPKVPPKTAAEAASLFDVIRQVPNRRREREE